MSVFLVSHCKHGYSKYGIDMLQFDWKKSGLEYNNIAKNVNTRCAQTKYCESKEIDEKKNQC